MIFTDEQIEQVLHSDNWSVVKSFREIAEGYGDNNEVITTGSAVFTSKPIANMIISNAPLKWVSMVKSIRSYNRNRRNLNRKPKTHFKK